MQPSKLQSTFSLPRRKMLSRNPAGPDSASRSNLHFHECIVGCFVLALVISGAVGASEPPVTVRMGEDGAATLQNGLIQMRIGQRGVLRELRAQDGTDLLKGGGRGYWNATSNRARETGGYVQPGGPPRIVRQSEDLVEVACRHKPYGRWSDPKTFPYDANLHYVLRRGESGFYLFMTIRYGPDMSAVSSAQFAYNLRLAPEIFDYLAVDDSRQRTMHSPEEYGHARRVMDATYRFENGEVVSKYQFCHEINRDRYHVYGWASSVSGRGVWLIQPSAEYYAASPFRQFLTSHQTKTTPVIIWQPQCGHFGSPTVSFESGDRFKKLYGPLFFYVNKQDNPRAAWRGAKQKEKSLAAKWPYAWMKHPWYPVRRGGVEGRLALEDGRPASGAFVILSPSDRHWARDARGYHFWTRTDEDGRFSIEHVRPGNYSLTATGCDRFEEFRRDAPVQVKTDETTNLGELTWQAPDRGRRVWQIGVVDRLPGEFRNGQDYRHWGLWRRYPEQFPQDVHYVVGQSDPSTDFNYMHWGWYSGEAPGWTVDFDMEQRPMGRAHLTFGICASAPQDRRSHGLNKRGRTDVIVRVNGEEVGRIRRPFTGPCSYRCGRYTTPYAVVDITFDASLLTHGKNRLELEHSNPYHYEQGDQKGQSGAGPGLLSYDAIRLEIDGVGD